MSAAPPIVLAIAASDPTGGAGIQADLLTLASLGCHPASAITALTVQDTHGVARIEAVEADLVVAQARAVLADLPVAAVKLGVLGSPANAAAVAQLLAEHPKLPVVLDPVLASGRGDPLADAASLQVLLPRTTVLTPNSVEARRLAGLDVLEECARKIVQTGCRYVLVTGTHEAGPQVVNTLYDARGKVREDRWPRLPGSYHGSGCTLASALAAFLARGMGIPEAARAAQDYTWQALASGFRPGSGQWLPDRFFDSHGEAARPLRDHA